MSVRVKSVGDWWEADPESKLFRLAERALAREWNVQPLFVREGGTMPVSRSTPSSVTQTCFRRCDSEQVIVAFDCRPVHVGPMLLGHHQRQ